MRFTILIALLLAAFICGGGTAFAVKASPPLEATMELTIPASFPGVATATFTTHSRVQGGTMTMEIKLPKACQLVSGSTRVAVLAITVKDVSMVVAFKVESKIPDDIVGTAIIGKPGSFFAKKSASASMIKKPKRKAATAATHEEKDGTLRFPGRTRVIEK
jgi:hypothetical protein